MNAYMDGRNYGWTDRGMVFFNNDDNDNCILKKMALMTGKKTSDDCGCPLNYHHYGNDDNDYPYESMNNDAIMIYDTSNPDWMILTTGSLTTSKRLIMLGPPLKFSKIFISLFIFFFLTG